MKYNIDVQHVEGVDAYDITVERYGTFRLSGQAFKNLRDMWARGDDHSLLKAAAAIVVGWAEEHFPAEAEGDDA